MKEGQAHPRLSEGCSLRKKIVKEIQIEESCFILLTLFFLSIPALAQKKDAPGCKDHPLVPTRMPNFRIEACDTKDFGAFEFFTDKGPKRVVEGKITSITHTVDERKNDRTPLEMVRNTRTP